MRGASVEEEGCALRERLRSTSLGERRGGEKAMGGVEGEWLFAMFWVEEAAGGGSSVESSGSAGVGRSERGRLPRMGLRGGGDGTGEGEREGSFSLWAEESESLSGSSGVVVVDGVVVVMGWSVRCGGVGRALSKLRDVSDSANVRGGRVGRVFITTLEAEAWRIVFDSCSWSSRNSVPASSPRFFASTTASLSSADTMACMEVMSFA